MSRPLAPGWSSQPFSQSDSCVVTPRGSVNATCGIWLTRVGQGTPTQGGCSGWTLPVGGTSRGMSEHHPPVEDFVEGEGVEDRLAGGDLTRRGVVAEVAVAALADAGLLLLAGRRCCGGGADGAGHGED